MKFSLISAFAGYMIFRHLSDPVITKCAVRPDHFLKGFLGMFILRQFLPILVLIVGNTTREPKALIEEVVDNLGFPYFPNRRSRIKILMDGVYLTSMGLCLGLYIFQMIYVHIKCPGAQTLSIVMHWAFISLILLIFGVELLIRNVMSRMILPRGDRLRGITPEGQSKVALLKSEELLPTFKYSKNRDPSRLMISYELFTLIPHSDDRKFYSLDLYCAYNLRCWCINTAVELARVEQRCSSCGCCNLPFQTGNWIYFVHRCRLVYHVGCANSLFSAYPQCCSPQVAGPNVEEECCPGRNSLSISVTRKEILLTKFNSQTLLEALDSEEAPTTDDDGFKQLLYPDLPPEDPEPEVPPPPAVPAHPQAAEHSDDEEIPLLLL